MGVEKKCNKCGITKSIGRFYKQKNGMYGRTGECKECRKQRTRKWISENKEKKLESDRKRDRKNREKNIVKNKKWREKNPDYFKEYYKQNSEIRLACNRRFWINNPERYESFKVYQNARRKKILVNPGQCQLCGEKELKIQGHHFDYSKPLEVTWLCRECHKTIHSKKKFTNNPIKD